MLELLEGRRLSILRALLGDILEFVAPALPPEPKTEPPPARGFEVVVRGDAKN
jgi:hypothetical protein